MLQPQNVTMKYEPLFVQIDTGKMKIPKFQREFVWTDDQTAKLLDSMIKGFPIGTFIFWKTREQMRHFRNIGNVALPEIPPGDAALYVLDGQQRITSLYAVRKGVRITRDGSTSAATLTRTTRLSRPSRLATVYPPSPSIRFSQEPSLNWRGTTPTISTGSTSTANASQGMTSPRSSSRSTRST